MKINTKFKAMVLATNINQGKDNKSYYSATIFLPASGEAGSINISEDVFNNIHLNEENTFLAEYNDKYSSFRVIGIE